MLRTVLLLKFISLSLFSLSGCGGAVAASAPAEPQSPSEPGSVAMSQPKPTAGATEIPANPSAKPLAETCIGLFNSGRSSLCVERGQAAPDLQWGGKSGLVKPVWDPNANRRLTGVSSVLNGEAVVLPAPPTEFELGQLSSDGERMLMFDVMRLQNNVVSVSSGKVLGRVELRNHCVHCPIHEELYTSADLRFAARGITQETPEETSKLSVEHIDVTHGFKRTRVECGAGRLPESIAFSPDGKSFTLLPQNGALTVWSVKTRRLQHSFELKFPPGRLLSAPDGKQAVAHYHDGTAQVVDLDTGKAEELPEFKDQVFVKEWASSFETTGAKRIVLGTDAGAYFVLDPEKMTWVGSLHLYADGSWLALDSQGQLAASALGMQHLKLLQGERLAPVDATTPMLRVTPQELFLALGLD